MTSISEAHPQPRSSIEAGYKLCTPQFRRFKDAISSHARQEILVTNLVHGILGYSIQVVRGKIASACPRCCMTSTNRKGWRGSRRGARGGCGRRGRESGDEYTADTTLLYKHVLQAFPNPCRVMSMQPDLTAMSRTQLFGCRVKPQSCQPCSTMCPCTPTTGAWALKAVEAPISYACLQSLC